MGTFEDRRGCSIVLYENLMGVTEIIIIVGRLEDEEEEEEGISFGIFQRFVTLQTP